MLRFGLVGENIATSYSPKIFSLLSEIADRPLRYELISGFDVNYLKYGFDGINVTIPFKQQAFALADVRSPAAESIGAANVLTFGTVVSAENTDAFAIQKLLSGEQGRVLILGAGGAARAAHFVCTQMGLETSVWNRSSQRLESWGVAAHVNGLYDILINATPSQHMAKWLEVLNPNAIVFDMNYRPAETPLLIQAKAKGFRTIYGLDMLIWQAMESFRVWTGLDLSEMKEKVHEISHGR
jgi:shikimate dehydrogenase